MKIAILILSLTLFSQKLFAQDIFSQMKQEEKAAILTVHSSHDKSSSLNTALFDERIRKAYPKASFFSTSIPAETLSLSSKLRELSLNGYSRLLVIPACISEGAEMSSIRTEIQAVQKKFSQIRISAPLLSEPTDMEEAADVISSEFGQAKCANVIVFITSQDDTAHQGTLFEYILHDKGFDNYFVVTTNGYPSVENLIRKLKKQKSKKVNIIPLSYLEDEALQTSLSPIIKSLQDAHYKVSQCPQSFATSNYIIDQFIKRAESARTNYRYSPLEKRMMHTTWKE